MSKNAIKNLTGKSTKPAKAVKATKAAKASPAAEAIAAKRAKPAAKPAKPSAADHAERAKAAEEGGAWSMAADLWELASQAATARKARQEYAGNAAAARVRAEASPAAPTPPAEVVEDVEADAGAEATEEPEGAPVLASSDGSAIDCSRAADDADNALLGIAAAATLGEELPDDGSGPASAVHNAPAPAAARRGPRKSGEPFAHDPRVLPFVGKELTHRTRSGELQILKVLVDGFSMNGVRYNSTSSAAKAANGGTNAPGPVYWGVEKSKGGKGASVPAGASPARVLKALGEASARYLAAARAVAACTDEATRSAGLQLLVNDAAIVAGLVK